jgi:hypothetical protein
MTTDRVDPSLTELLAAQALTETDRRFHYLANDPELGRADYGEFLFAEAVAVLTSFEVYDPEGHLCLWVKQGYISGGRAIAKRSGAAFASTERGVYSFQITSTGREIAHLANVAAATR